MNPDVKEFVLPRLLDNFPTPWEVVEQGHKLFVYPRYSWQGTPQLDKQSGRSFDFLQLQQRKTGASRGSSPRWLGYDPEQRRLMEHAVACVNAHEELVESLEQIRAIARGDFPIEQRSENRYEDRVRAVLEIASGTLNLLKKEGV